MNLKYLFFVALFTTILLSPFLYAQKIVEGKANDDIRKVVYGSGEVLKYKISWSGGIKIGELHMEVKKINETLNHYKIHARAKDSGIFHFFYPVDDTFDTLVDGNSSLPLVYDVEQKEGRSYQATRHTEYDQGQGIVRYRKNNQEITRFSVAGEVHNEFSSFFFTRLLPLEQAKPVIVPTFADKKRHEVVVQTYKRTRFNNTAVGDVNVIPVNPIMNFKGLYDKDGATVIYLTDDQCRIPVRIESKILIGFLAAELVSYSNPSCKDQSQYHIEIPKGFSDREKLGFGD